LGRGKVPEAAGRLASSGDTAWSETTQLYRAVSREEFEQLMRTGKFEASPNALEGKFFAESTQNAARWGEALEGAGKYHIVEIELPINVAPTLMRWERLNGIGPARYGALSLIGRMGSCVDSQSNSRTVRQRGDEVLPQRHSRHERKQVCFLKHKPQGLWHVGKGKVGEGHCGTSPRVQVTRTSPPVQHRI